ncbi:tetratricopeptide repeat protein [Vannielia litorea]|uniref:tetratricopeptide repeat protein n=1 Tax=Vannielia litorea TaxID=1217970 RepID=UPI001BCAD3B1|nr:tetratricopeptide repeat protein [Vannielia litorea]MBS8225415.1 hypothetical protein [Vannielia litorea]
MMRWLALILFLTLHPTLALAQDTGPDGPAFDAMLSRMNSAVATSNDDEIYATLNSGIRDARETGQLTPGWSIFYAMLTDLARLQKDNPAYALQLAEDGLALVARADGTQDEVGWALMVSKAYALADLGRYAEAVEVGRQALPLFRGTYGDEAADEFAGYVNQWERGELGDFNRSALDIAQERITRAEQAYMANEFGRTIELAQSARLPGIAGAGEAGVRVRGMNFRAENLVGQAQFQLGRQRDACGSLLSALRHVAAPWDGSTRISWHLPPESPADRQLFYMHMSRLSACASHLGQPDLANAALLEAEALANRPDQKADAMTSRASLLAQSGDWEGAHDLLQEAVDVARTSGNPLIIDATRFYAALVAVKTAALRGVTAPTEALAEAAEVILRQTEPPLGHVFVLRETAETLLGIGETTAALEFSERSVNMLRSFLDTSTDSQFGTDQARAGMSNAVETFLSAAHRTAEARGAAHCPAAKYRHCVIEE